MRPHEKKRMLFMGLLFPILLTAQFLGFDSIWVTGVFAGILGGLSVVLFPDPDHRS